MGHGKECWLVFMVKGHCDFGVTHDSSDKHLQRFLDCTPVCSQRFLQSVEGIAIVYVPFYRETCVGVGEAGENRATV